MNKAISHQTREVREEENGHFLRSYRNFSFLPVVMALYLLSGHHLITPFDHRRGHNCARERINRRRVVDNYSSPSLNSYYSAFDIQFEDYQDSAGHQIIKNASVLKLVEYLTHPRLFRLEFTRTFFFTFRSFCSPDTLLNLLIRRFQVLTPLNLQTFEYRSNSPYCNFRDKHRRPVQKRVLQTLYFWICNHPKDFLTNVSLLNQLELFLGGEVCQFNVLQRIWCAKIKRMLRKRQLDNEEPENPIAGIQALLSKRRQRPRAFNSKFSTYLYLNTKSGFVNTETFWRIKPSKIAKQLTLLHFYLYQSIEFVEFLNNNGRHRKCPHLIRIIEFSTKITYWVVRSIVEQPKIERRAFLIGKILEIMQECINLNNYNGFVDLYSALNQTAVFRLKRTKELLDPDKQVLLEQFQSLFDPHWKKLSVKVKTCTLPCVPFIGVYLSQLVFIENGQPTVVKTGEAEQDRVVSFRKCRKIASVVEEIKRFQRQAYLFKVDRSILRFFLFIDPEEGFNSRNELEDYLYKRSLLSEPKT